MQRDIRIDGAFPGGNIVLEGRDGDDVGVHQDLRDTAGDWFYWCFRVRGAAGRTLRFHFTRSLALGVRGPGFSLDRGRTWRWLGKQAGEDHGFAFSFPEAPDEVRFSFGMPYQAAHWRAFCRALRPNPQLRQGKLCRTSKGRVVEYARLGCLAAEPAERVAITCRHHCCEMMANYVLEGLIRFVLTGSGKAAEWLRTQLVFS